MSKEQQQPDKNTPYRFTQDERIALNFVLKRVNRVLSVRDNFGQKRAVGFKRVDQGDPSFLRREQGAYLINTDTGECVLWNVIDAGCPEVYKSVDHIIDMYPLSTDGNNRVKRMELCVNELVYNDGSGLHREGVEHARNLIAKYRSQGSISDKEMTALQNIKESLYKHEQAQRKLAAVEASIAIENLASASANSRKYDPMDDAF